MPVFNEFEQFIFDDLLHKAIKNIAGWSEEDLKMKFISGVLPLGKLTDNGRFLTYFEKTIFATIEGHYLSTKSDFMVATGILDKPKKPYFHFQEYKPHKKPTGDSTLWRNFWRQCLSHSTKTKMRNPFMAAKLLGEFGVLPF